MRAVLPVHRTDVDGKGAQRVKWEQFKLHKVVQLCQSTDLRSPR